MGKDSKHILMLPYMAQGHLIPFLRLAKKILQTHASFIITILSTPLNIKYLRSALNKQEDDNNDEVKSKLFLVELPFCSTDHGLPPHEENTQFIPSDLLIKLFNASTTLEAPVRRFISEEIVGKEGRPPICIITDDFLGWGIEVAKSFGSIGIAFSTGGLYGTAAYVTLWNHLPHQHIKDDDEEFTLPGFPDNHLFKRTELHLKLRVADGTDEWSRFFQSQLKRSMTATGWICNAVEEMEPLGMSILTKYLNLPIWTIGPLIPESMLLVPVPSDPLDRTKLGEDSETPSGNWNDFLNSHPPDSVLYISFGSQNTIPLTQMMELAIGLEVSEKPFIWVIRPPFGFNIRGEFKDEWLPEGFKKRVTESGKGLLLHKWAPQTKILSHESTGGFLSHCGWNSVMESLSQGVPIIGWPLAGEQAYNLKMLEQEIGVAIELTKGIQGSVNREKVREIVRLVLDREGRGSEMKKMAVEASKQLKAAVREEAGHRGSSLRAMDDLVETILSS